jgi:phospholipid/cholesterol/gamma-HCH transport system substrate-binding protein
MEATLSKLNSIADGIDRGEGTMGKLLKDKELYDNLTGATEQLELLLEDLRLNPKRYMHFSLFGKKPKQYEAPQDTVQ